MDIRQAILKAADHIEQNPDDFSFWSIETPSSCGTPACALGWIGYFSGLRDGLHRRILPSLGLPEDGDGAIDFYQRCSELSGHTWKHSAKECAVALRSYADQYHPAESRALIPESVARIFRMSHAELTRELETA